jgi:hypothetical protein
MPIRVAASAALLALACLVPAALLPAGATWKPEFGRSPQAVQDWFAAAEIAGGQGGPAHRRLHILKCCNQAERLRTRFVATPGHQWSYYPDAACIVKGCPILPVPDDVVHRDRIRAPDPKDDALPEFQEMRREGVLFHLPRRAVVLLGARRGRRLSPAPTVGAGRSSGRRSAASFRNGEHGWA